jgi:hypothetical protein
MYQWKFDVKLRVATCLAEARHLALRLIMFSPERSQVFGTSFGQPPDCKVVGVHPLVDVVVNDSVALLHWRRM